MHFFDVDSIKIRSDRLFLIAGPCVLDDTGVAYEIAAAVKEIAEKLAIPFIFKASYVKANRTSGKSYRGPGLVGLNELQRIKSDMAIPILSDVHSVEEVSRAKEVLDILQIPAFLCRQTALIEACAKTDKAVNIKKGQFMAPWDMKYALEKVSDCGNHRIFLTERGTSFGYNNLVVDMRVFPVMKEFGYPVIFDGTHSVQLPGGGQGETAGNREMIPFLVKAAVAAGCDGLFLEVHPAPQKSPSDSASILPLGHLEECLKEVMAIRKALQFQK